MWLLLERSAESPRPSQRHLEVIDPEKQEEAVTRLRVIGAHQGGMLMGTPLVKAEQDRSIRVEDLTEVTMGGSRLAQAKERLVPLEAVGNAAYADDRPCAFHSFSANGPNENQCRMLCDLLRQLPPIIRLFGDAFERFAVLLHVHEIFAGVFRHGLMMPH
jgi:hypothetical protein